MDTVSPFAPDNNPQKRCTGPCGRLLPATLEYFHRQKLRKDGLNALCKVCATAKAKAHYQAHQEQKQEYARQYYEANKDQALARVTAFRQNNPEIIKARKQAYYSIPEKREYKRLQDKAYQKQMPSEQRAKDRARRNVRRRTPEMRQRRQGERVARLALQRGIAGKFTPAQIREQLQRQKNKCYYCSTKFQQAKGRYIYHIDHTFPISRVAGTDIPANSIEYLVLTCPKCNTSKGNKFPWEWPEGGRLL